MSHTGFAQYTDWTRFSIDTSGAAGNLVGTVGPYIGGVLLVGLILAVSVFVVRVLGSAKS